MPKLTEGILKEMKEDSEDVSPELLARAEKRLRENPVVEEADKDQELYQYLAFQRPPSR
jgi:hypothetical protein